MKLKDFIVEQKQIIIEGENYNYEVIDMEAIFAELLAESPANLKCIGNITLVTKLLKLLGNNKDKTLALADVDDLDKGIAFNNEAELNDAIATTLIHSGNWAANIKVLVKEFPDIKSILSTWKSPEFTNKSEIIKIVAGSCEFTKEVIKLTKSTFIMAWKDVNGHIPGEAA